MGGSETEKLSQSHEQILNKLQCAKKQKYPKKAGLAKEHPDTTSTSLVAALLLYIRCCYCRIHRWISVFTELQWLHLSQGYARTTDGYFKIVTHIRTAILEGSHKVEGVTSFYMENEKQKPNNLPTQQVDINSKILKDLGTVTCFY